VWFTSLLAKAPDRVVATDRREAASSAGRRQYLRTVMNCPPLSFLNDHFHAATAAARHGDSTKQAHPERPGCASCGAIGLGYLIPSLIVLAPGRRRSRLSEPLTCILDPGEGACSVTQLRQVVHSDPDILGGVPVFVATRVPMQSLFDYLEGGE